MRCRSFRSSSFLFALRGSLDFSKSSKRTAVKRAGLLFGGRMKRASRAIRLSICLSTAVLLHFSSPLKPNLRLKGLMHSPRDLSSSLNGRSLRTSVIYASSSQLLQAFAFRRYYSMFALINPPSGKQGHFCLGYFKKCSFLGSICIPALPRLLSLKKLGSEENLKPASWKRPLSYRMLDNSSAWTQISYHSTYTKNVSSSLPFFLTLVNFLLYNPYNNDKRKHIFVA